MEINLISFIPLISNVKNMYNTEASLKYFILQVLASATLLFIVIIQTLTEDLFTFEKNPYAPIINCTPEWPRGFQEVKVPRLRDNGTGWS